MDLMISSKSTLYYDWDRFWTGSPENLNVYDFLPDYEGFLEQRGFANFDRINHLSCLLLLGDPGIGKSRTVQKIASNLVGQGEKVLYVAMHRYRSFDKLMTKLFSDNVYQNWLQGGDVLHLFLDGLDEARLNDKQFDHDIINYFQELSSEHYQRLNLRITCRTAELPADFVDELQAVKQSKSKVVGMNAVQTLYLAKLRRTDVVAAATSLSIDPNDFLHSVSLSGANTFAAHPITLDMLFRIYTNEGQLPNKKAEIYALGCRYLAEEVSSKRHQDGIQGDFEVQDRLEAARHIAGLTIISNRQIIESGIEESFDGNAIHIRDCYLPAETKWKQPENLLRETLRTPLFTGLSMDIHLWSHRSYGEYLTAEYLYHNELTLQQIQSLLINPSDTQQHIAPVLRETAAWLATMNNRVFHWILNTEPAILLNSDSVYLEEQQKADLVKWFLQNRSLNLSYESRLEWYAYHQFAHSALGDDLAPYLADRKLDEGTRDFAMTLAAYCNVDSIDEILIDIATDPTESLSLRQGALSALRRPDQNSHPLVKLRSILFGSPINVNDDLVARTLGILWPKFMTATELFSLISFVPFDSMLSSNTYEAFIGHDLVESLHVDDIPIALQWLFDNMQEREVDLSLGSQRLISSIMIKAWDHLDSDKIRIKFAHIVWKMIQNHSNVLPSPNGDWSANFNNDQRNFQLESKQDHEKRRTLLLTMLGWLKSEKLRDPYTFSDLKRARGLSFVTVEDIPWLIEQISVAHNSDWQEAFLLLIQSYLPTDYGMIHWELRDDDISAMNFVYESLDTNHTIKKRFGSLFEPILLGSPRSQQSKQWLADLKQKRKQWIDNSSPIVNLRGEIETTVNECQIDVAHWIVLDRWLRSDIYGRYWDNILDVRKGEGWQSIESDAEIISEIVEVARRYLQQQDISITEGGDVSDAPEAMAGYRALILIATHGSLDSIIAETWIKWGEAIVFGPSNVPREITYYDVLLLKNAFAYDAAKLILRLAAIINNTDRPYRVTSLLRRFSYAPRDAVVGLLLNLLEKLTPEDEIFFELFRFLVYLGVSQAEQHTLSFVKALSEKAQIDLLKRIFGIFSQLSYNGDWWSSFWELLHESWVDRKDVLNAIIDWRENNYLQYLNDGDLQNLYELAVDVYPYSEDKIFHGGAVPDWHIKQEWRDSILQAIATRGSMQGIEYLGSLERATLNVPNITYLIGLARERYRMESWIPPHPIRILQLANDQSKVYLRNENQLQKLVITTLEQINTEFKGSAVKQYALWHRQSDGSFQPVEREERFANAIAEWLSEKISGVVINRESQVHHGLFSSQGNSTDILVEAITDLDERITVIIEVKCCWYEKILEKMQTQLVDQYLLQHATCQHGIYLVGYFSSSNWSRKDGRRENLCSRWDLEELEDILESEADGLQLAKTMQVTPFVFDASVQT